MITTQVSLPDNVYRNLERLYGAKGKKPADVIREALVKRAESNAGNRNLTLDRLETLRIKGGPKDLASHIDDYLYGDKK